MSTTEQELYFWGRKDLTDEDVCIDDLEETVTEKKMKRGTTTEIFDKNVVTLPSLILRFEDFLKNIEIVGFQNKKKENFCITSIKWVWSKI